MPMVYVADKTVSLVERVVRHLRANANFPSRIIKADVIHVALEEYAKKLGVRGGIDNGDMA